MTQAQPIKARLANQLDLIALRRLDTEGDAVLAPSALDDTRGVLSSVLMPGGEKTWLAESNAGFLGFAQARPRKYVLGWELTTIRLRPDADHQGVTSALIAESLQHLQDRGIPRLFARTSEDSDGQALLVGAGFTHLLSESVYVRQPAPARPPTDTPVGMRYRMPQDAWPLRQLENGQTPVLISQLEGLTSAGWSMPRRQMFRRDEPADLVIERSGEIVGWVGWTFVNAGHSLPEHVRMALLTHTDHSDLAAPLLDYALYVIGAKRPNSETILRIRDYNVPPFSMLGDRGFDESARYMLYIKHGRLQVVTQPTGKLFELAPKARAFAVEPRSGYFGGRRDR